MTDAPEIPVIQLREGSVDQLELPPAVAAALNRRSIAEVSPWSDTLWRVSNVSRVGALRLEGVEVRIAPKVPMRNLLALASGAGSWDFWLDDTLSLDEAEELERAVARVFLSYATRALRAGVLRGYVERREAHVSVRGRILVSEQLRRRVGLPIPIELQYDDFTADIPVNRVLRTAARRLLESWTLPAQLRSALLGVERVLGEASLLVRGAPLPGYEWDRRSERFRPAVALAELILTNGSLDHRVGGRNARGFLLDLPRVFEGFVEAEVRRAAHPHGGRIVSQERVALDRDGRVHIKPDLVWRDSRGVRAVFDAKYKAEKPAGFPNADIYQMLVYCIRHRVPTGHLIYAAGNEPRARHVVEEAGVTVVCHALDLEGSSAVISSAVDAIVGQAIASSH